jgi:hypothetical protein
MPQLENIPTNEEENIKTIADLTIKQLEKRYAGKPPILRGVHAKDHGCVRAKFKVDENIREDLRVGVFARPGQVYDVLIRFSNASVAEDPDSTLDVKTKALGHGSRGMAIKLLGVSGAPLLNTEEPLTQDFLLINQPVFAFANVEDYRVLSQIVFDSIDQPPEFFGAAFGKAFFTQTKSPDALKAAQAGRTLNIVGRVRSGAMETTPPPPGSPPTGAYQTPPASPLDNQYFSGAPFLFGEDHAVKFSAKPVATPVGVDPRDVADSRYLRTALRKRLAAPDAGDVVFKFQVQIRTAKELADKIDTDIEDATVEWPQIPTTEPPRDGFPFVDVATITIPPQDFETATQRALCESLTFSPWHGLVEHRPLGGINRLRRPVYEASSQRRLGAKGAGGCPMSGIS